MRLSWLCVISFIILFIFIATSFADESLQLIATINLGTDSTFIASFAPAGDFNGDGYNDLLIGMKCRWWHTPLPFEAAYLFYGGPQFDTIPDLIFRGHFQDTICEPVHEDWLTEFGQSVLGLGDFNGDGFDDIAIGAPAYCSHDYQSGRIYIYFGGTNPDTSDDLFIDGHRWTDHFGMSMAKGNFNGDSLSDILVEGEAAWEGAKFFIYLGAIPPDTASDWMYSCVGRGILYGSDNIGVSDINGDGYDDLGLGIMLNDYPYWEYYMFLGGNPIGITPIDSFTDYWPKFPGDVSGDAIDDIIFPSGDGACYLCLGGNPVNFDPDYFMGHGQFYNIAFIMNLAGGIRKLLTDNINYHRHDIQLYNLGVPFDTIPYCTLDYGHHHAPVNLDLGDINGDGIDELGFEDTLGHFIQIYTLIPTGINETHELPKQNTFLSAYPNPFNSSTIITYSNLPKKDEIIIYNINGQKVKTLRTEGKAGQINWDACDASGKKVSSGIYFARLESGADSKIIKMVLLK